MESITPAPEFIDYIAYSGRDFQILFCKFK